MSRTTVAIALASALRAASAPAHAHGLSEVPAALVAVSVQVDGRPASLYPAPDGSGRYYLEAAAGSRYAVVLSSRTGERLGVVLTVDGLNAISGERDSGRGRMYVLDAWQSTSVQGWRSSLQEVRQFRFVDERRSYAARMGRANEKMGWIEIAVYRERHAYAHSRPYPLPLPLGEPKRQRPADAETADRGRAEAPAAAPAAPRSSEPATADEATALTAKDSRARSYPGTGWGERRQDPVVLVSFDPELAPSERVTLRYEYRAALVALGVLPPHAAGRDRLWQRDHAEPGFAQPPRW
jgi:hypothetical protein